MSSAFPQAPARPPTPTQGEGERRRRFPAGAHAAVSASLTYAVLMMGSGIVTPYFPIWLQSRGFDANQMAMLLSLPMLMRVVASAPIGRLGDSWLGPRRTLLMVTCGTALFYASLTFTGHFWPVALLLTLASICVAPTGALLDTIVLDNVATYGHDYGRIRQWGSLAWVGASLMGGLVVAHLPHDAIPPILGLLYAASVLVGLWLPDDRKATRRGPADSVGGSAPPVALFVLVLGAVAALQGAHAFLYAFGTVIWQSDGFSGTAIGSLWGLSVFVETCVFMLSGLVSSRVGPYGLMLTGATAALIRWIGFGSGVTFWPALALLQALHGASFALVHLGTMRWLSRYRTARSTRQGIVNAAIGAGLTAVTVASGPLYTLLGVRGYWVMAMVTATGVGLVLAAAAKERPSQPQRSGAGGSTTLPR